MDNKIEVKLEDYKGIPMLVLYYGAGGRFNIRLTKKKIELLTDYMPIAQSFVKAIEAKKLGMFKIELESLGYSQEPHEQPKHPPVGMYAPEDGAKVIAKNTKPIIESGSVTFK